MSLSESKENADRREQVCPFLGLRDDPATALSFPSSHNRCFHAKPALPVKLDFQRTYCLTSKYSNCEEFNREPDTPLPSNLRFKDVPPLQEKIINGRVWILFLVFIVIALIAWQVLSRGHLGVGNSGQSPAVTVPAISTIIGFQTPSILSTRVQNPTTPTLSLTTTPTFPIHTFAPTNVSFHVFETPIGVEYKLVIHRVLAGESLMSIASQYWTTVDAIQAVNYYLPSPLQIDWLIIVPANQTDVHGLPAFEVYEVKMDVAVRALAQQLSIDPAIFELYNGFGNNEFLSSGEWVLIPHMSTATP
jgi:hypothetical protein